MDDRPVFTGEWWYAHGVSCDPVERRKGVSPAPPLRVCRLRRKEEFTRCLHQLLDYATYVCLQGFVCFWPAIRGKAMM